MTPQQKAFLDMIAASEIGPELLKLSDNGYNVLVGSTAEHFELFGSYKDHPDIYNKTLNSTAAGRYQILYRWWEAYKNMLHLPDFSPASQDAVALQQIKERGALDDIEAGRLESAIEKCASIWASLPGNDYGQHTNSYELLESYFTQAGGTLS